MGVTVKLVMGDGSPPPERPSEPDYEANPVPVIPVPTPDPPPLPLP